MSPIRVLFVEDSEDDNYLIIEEFKKGGLDLQYARVENEAQFREKLREGGWDAVISDFNLPGFTGLRALAIVKEMQIDAPFLLVSGTVGEEQAVEAMRMGAQDYIMKGNLARLVPALKRELEEFERRRKSEAMLLEREKQLRDAQKFEIIGQIAGGLSHDFNNILGVIDLELENVIEGSQDRGPVEKSATAIQKAIGRANSLVRQLLTIGRQRGVTLELVDLNRVLRDCEPILRIALGDDKELKLSLVPALPQVQADPAQLEQLLVNLVLNARDAMTGEGVVVIETSLADDGSVKRAKLSVRDNGCGMDEDTMSRIFDPFFTTKEIGKGSGLGLSSVRSIAQQHGAEISVESEIGKGTCFHLLFPDRSASA